MMDQTEMGLVTALLGAFGYTLGHIVARKKNKADVKGKELENNATIAIRIWRELYEKLQLSVNSLIEEVNELKDENGKLREQIAELKRLIKNKN